MNDNLEEIMPYTYIDAPAAATVWPRIRTELASLYSSSAKSLAILNATVNKLQPMQVSLRECHHSIEYYM